MTDNSRCVFQVYFCRIRDDVLRQLEGEKQGLRVAYEGVHSKLRVMHGHPNNGRLLAKLNEEFDDLVREKEEVIKKMLTPHQVCMVLWFFL